MKELSIEEKAKRYDKVIERAIKYRNNDGLTFEQYETIDIILPELKESEDEKIRKELIKFVKERFAGFPQCDKYLTWLEKQGECHISHDDEIMIEQLTEYFTTGHGLQNTNETVVEFLKGVKEKLEKQGEQKPYVSETMDEKEDFDNGFTRMMEKEQKPNPVLDIEIPFGAKDSELQEASYHIPEGCYATIDGNRVVIKRGERKPTDKVEPKFKVGDWIIHNKNTELANSLMLVTDKVSDGYLCKYRDGQCSYNIEFIDKEYKLWTIQDANDGDVLSWDDSECIALFKNIYDEDSFNSHGLIGHCTGTFEPRQAYHDIEGVHPATKEQHYLLFQKMKEAGYEWNADEKKLKKIEQKPAENAEPKFNL